MCDFVLLETLLGASGLSGAPGIALCLSWVLTDCGIVIKAVNSQVMPHIAGSTTGGEGPQQFWQEPQASPY